MSREDSRTGGAIATVPPPETVERAIGLDIGATKWLAIADGHLEVEGQVHDDPARTLADVLARVAPVHARATLACSFAGVMDRNGAVESWPNRSSWSGFRLAQALATAGPVVVEDDGLCAAIGERMRGVARDAESFVCITIGTGIGSGLFLGGRPRRPLPGRPAGIGHVRAGLHQPCGCGGTGCLQAALLDDLATASFDAAARRFAEMVADLAILLDLQAIVLTGGRLARDDRLRASLADALARELSGLSCEVRVSADPTRSAAFGAQILAAGWQEPA